MLRRKKAESSACRFNIRTGLKDETISSRASKVGGCLKEAILRNRYQWPDVQTLEAAVLIADALQMKNPRPLMNSRASASFV